MANELLVYHYFMDQTDPFLTCTETGSGNARELAALGLPMQGYDVGYFEKRLAREKLCRNLFIAAGGAPKTAHPYYFTLGRQDDIFLRQRRHRNAVAIPLAELPSDRVSFTLGDSVGLGEEKLRGGVLTEAGLMRIHDTVGRRLQDVDPPDRYVEVQLWDDEPLKRYRPRYAESTGVPEFIEGLVRIGLNAVPELKDEIYGYPQIGLRGLLRTLENAEIMEEWRALWREGIDLSVLPPGRIHGMPHSVRTSLMAAALALSLGMDRTEALFAARCAAYHDTGRTLGDQREHAERSARLIRPYFEAAGERLTAQAVIAFHDRLTETEKTFPDERTAAHAGILHDADSLDYLRFGLRLFRPDCLLLRESREMILAACELNLYSAECGGWYGKLIGKDPLSRTDRSRT